MKIMNPFHISNLYFRSNIGHQHYHSFSNTHLISFYKALSFLINCILLGIVRLTPNVTLGGTATQSSTAGVRFEASNANDGVFENNGNYPPCSVTRTARVHWWQVDLLEIYEITKVTITGRAVDSKCLFKRYFCLCPLFLHLFSLLGFS